MLSTCLRYGRSSSVLKKVVGSERFLPEMMVASVANPSPAVLVSACWPHPCRAHGEHHAKSNMGMTYIWPLSHPLFAQALARFDLSIVLSMDSQLLPDYYAQYGRHGCKSMRACMQLKTVAKHLVSGSVPG